jgi:hypothetical protein
MNLSLSVGFLLILSLNDSNSFIQAGQEMRKFWVDLIDQIGKISTCFIINSLEEHNRSEILFEILQLIVRNLSLQNINDTFFFSRFYLLSEGNDLILQSDDTIDISSQSLRFSRVNVNNLLANDLNFVVWTSCDIINKISDRYLGTFRYNIFNVLASHKLWVLDGLHDGLLSSRLENLVLFLLTRLLEKNDFIASDKVIYEPSLGILE